MPRGGCYTWPAQSPNYTKLTLCPIAPLECSAVLDGPTTLIHDTRSRFAGPAGNSTVDAVQKEACVKKALVFCAAVIVLLAARSYAQSWPTISSRVDQLRGDWPVKGESQKEAAREAFVKNLEANKSEALKALDRNALDLSGDLDALHNRMTTIKQALDTTGTLLKVPGVAHKQLQALEASLKTAHTMLGTAEVVPQTRKKAQDLRARITPALDRVKNARESIGKIAITTDPLSVKLLKAAKRVGQTDTVLVAFNTLALHPEPFATTVAQECVNGAAVDRRECMQGKVDEKARDIDAVVVKFDQAVEILLTDVGAVEALLPTLPAINSMMLNLDQYQKLLGPITKSLDELIAPLRELDSLLDTSLKECGEVPTTPWTTQRVCTPDIRMRVIVDGAGAIMNEIEKLVGGAALALLKELGLRDLADALISAAQEPLNIILRKLNLDLEIPLGDIEALTRLPGQLDAPLRTIDIDFDARLPELDASLPSLGLPGVPDVKAIDPLWFNPGNLLRTDVPVVPCRQGLYICN